MNRTHNDATPENEPLKTVIRAFLESGQKSGNYRDGLERVLTDWRTHLETTSDITTVDAVGKRAMASYATQLADRVDAKQNRGSDVDGITAATAWTYYDYVSAFLSWCVKWDSLPENPAQKGAALDELPPRPSHNSGDQQFWTTEDRYQLLSYADQRVNEVLEKKGLDAVEELRNRALVYVLAYSGVRGGEILSDPRDSRRDGLRWADVHLEDGYLTILGKNQTEEQAQLPEQTHTPLQRLRKALSPTDDTWPVFPTAHTPTLTNGLPDGVEREKEETWLNCYRKHGVAPSSLSTNGGRTVLKRLCEDADIDVDGGYLKPHGARRGVGELVYRERGAAAAQRTLRHADPRTTAEMYSHIEAGELAEEVSEIFENDDIPESYR